MDDLQYLTLEVKSSFSSFGFKPCYKWMTFNTEDIGIAYKKGGGFKPCYKWMTFNTISKSSLN